MSLDTNWFWSVLVVFARASGLVALAPVFGSRTVPVPVRVGLSGMLALGLAPVVQPAVGAPPGDWLPLITRLLSEAVMGIVLGYGVNLLVGAAVMAGELLDQMMGFSMMQLLNPLSTFPTSLLAQFHYLLALTLFALVDGHHLLLMALARSFEVSGDFTSFQSLAEGGLALAIGLGTQVLWLCLQIAAPAAGVLFVVDSAMAALSRAVPQVPIWLIGVPAKIAVGVVALALSLPAMTGITMRLTDLCLRYLEQVMRWW